ncbi:MAG TPA: tRNA lysidine(34) synthetase TilS [Thermoanaerobaculia bacterium]|nr:tRNA lysidine(34) synthetase TilS [Thermoanaerobaculia bacterium]
MNLTALLADFFERHAPLSPLDRILVSFSGGPDSTALLLGLAQLSQRRPAPLSLLAFHLDHGLDPGSGDRAAAAGRTAAALALPFRAERREVRSLRLPGESLEVAARRVRYALLAEVAREIGARYVATAHHRGDQAETVLLRLLFGSGLTGLSGIRPVSIVGGSGGAVLLRPLLAAPRSALMVAVEAAGLTPADDPTNRDLRQPRNRVRHQLLPALSATHPGPPSLEESLARLARRAAGASRRLAALLAERLGPLPTPGGTSISRLGFERLPEALRAFALAAVHRQAGAPYPASAQARAELLRQLARPGRVGCDCGGGWRWEGRGRGENRRLLLRPPSRRAVSPGFTYTSQMPVEIFRERSGEVRTDGT